MKNITHLFEETLRLQDQNIFDKEVWLLSLQDFREKKEFINTWNEPEDNWLTFEFENKFKIMAARNVPIAFFAEEKLKFEFDKFYEQQYSSLIVNNPSLKMFSVDVLVIAKLFHWDHEVMAEKFSLNDLFYQTH